MDQFKPVCTYIDSFAPIWTPHGPMWTNFDLLRPICPIWPNFVPFGKVWTNLDLFGPVLTWTHLDAFGQIGVIWSNLEPYILVWTQLDLFRVWVLFCPERLRFFCPEKLRDFLSREVAWFFFVLRGCVIFFPQEVECFLCLKRLHDFFLSWEVALFFFVPRVCVIFLVPRGFSLSQENAWFFVPRG